MLLLPPLITTTSSGTSLNTTASPFSTFKPELFTLYVSQNIFNRFDFAIKVNAEGQMIVNGMWFGKKKRIGLVDERENQKIP